jgi:hypothetical protein
MENRDHLVKYGPAKMDLFYMLGAASYDDCGVRDRVSSFCSLENQGPCSGAQKAAMYQIALERCHSGVWTPLEPLDLFSGASFLRDFFEIQ